MIPFYKFPFIISNLALSFKINREVKNVARAGKLDQDNNALQFPLSKSLNVNKAIKIANISPSVYNNPTRVRNFPRDETGVFSANIEKDKGTINPTQDPNNPLNTINIKKFKENADMRANKVANNDANIIGFLRPNLSPI